MYTSKDAIKVRVYETYLAKEKMNSDLFDFQVRLPKCLLLETYAEILHVIEPDSMVVQLSNVKIIKNDYEKLIAGDRIEPGLRATTRTSCSAWSEKRQKLGFTASVVRCLKKIV